MYKSSGSEQSGQETLTVTSVSGGVAHFESTVEDTYRRGFLTESFANGSIKKTDGKVEFTGDLALITVDRHTSVIMPGQTLTILDENIEEETVLYEKENATVVDDDFEIVVQGRVTIDYSMTVTQKAPVELEPHGEVIPVELRIDIHSLRLASDELGGFDVDVFEPEAVDGSIVVTNHFAHGKGLVHSTTTTKLDLRTIGDIVEEILGEPMDADALEAVGAPDLRPIDATLTQNLTN